MLGVVQEVSNSSNFHFLAMKCALDYYSFAVLPQYSGFWSVFSATGRSNYAIFDSFALFYPTSANLQHFISFSGVRLYLLIAVAHLLSMRYHFNQIYYCYKKYCCFCASYLVTGATTASFWMRIIT